MKIAVLIPDRGDRPQLLERCLMMMERQTLKPAHIELVNDAPLSDAVDITWRYRLGYERISSFGSSFDSDQDDIAQYDTPFDLIAFIENDDWYHPRYLEYMAAQWVANGRPHLLGLDHTHYYHIGWRRWFVLRHPRRSNAMNTCIMPGLDVQWPLDHDPYLDVWLWGRWSFNSAQDDIAQDNTILRKVVLTPDKVYCLGIKHGVGLCGGKNHVDGQARYVNDDADGAWLEGKVGSEDMEWYLMM